MKRFLTLLIALFALASSARAEDAPDFQKHIAPLFKQYCLGCHNASDHESNFSLETYDALVKGGDGGSVLALSKPEESRLLLLLEGKAEPKMPPEDNEAPTADEIALIRRWLVAGAKGPTGAAPDPTVLVTPKIAVKGAARRPLNAAAISPDGKLAAIGGYASVQLISPESRAVLRVFKDVRGAANDVRFSNDGKLIVAASGEPGVFGEARVWNVETGKLVRAFTGHRDSLYAAALSPDAKILATSSYDQEIKLWNVADGALLRTLVGHNGAVFDLAFHPKGHILASASADRTVKLWNVADGARLDTFSQPLKDVYAVAFSPDGSTVIGGGADNRIRAWRLSDTAAEGTNKELLVRYAHEGAVLNLAYSPDGATIVSTAENYTVKIWKAATLDEVRVLERQTDWAPGVAIGADNRALLVARLDGSTNFYDLTTGQYLPPAKPELLAVSPRGLQRGATAPARITGKNLLIASVVTASDKRIVAKLISSGPQSADAVEVELTASADIPPGKYTLAVTTPGGASNEIPIHIDTLPQLAETEPNDGRVQTVSLPASIWGAISAPGDLDKFSFEPAVGRTLLLYIDAASINSTLNSVLTLIGPNGDVVASNNDLDGAADSFIAYDVKKPGRYTVRVTDLTNTGTATHFYRLSAGDFPLATGAWPAIVSQGAETKVELTGFNLSAGEHVTVKPEKAGDLALTIDAARIRSARPLKIRVDAIQQSLEAEPNNAPENASPLSTSSKIVARIGAPGDVDLFRFEAQKGQSLVLETLADRLGSPLDTKIEILDMNGQPIPRVQLQAVRETTVDFRPMTSVEFSARPKHYQEIGLNQLVYMNGEVAKAVQLPMGPDSDLVFFNRGLRRRNYFDTTGSAHAIEEPMYAVEAHPIGKTVAPNGLPIFTLYYMNDDESDRKLGKDSKLTFTAPETGAYLARVSDVRGFGGDRFSYQLTLREPKPDFEFTLAEQELTVDPNSGRRLTFNVERRDNFDGPITISVENLPEGFSASLPVVVERDFLEARAVLFAAPDAKQPDAAALAKIKITATAEVAGKPVSHNLKTPAIKLGAKPQVVVRVTPSELTIHPGETITAMLTAERNGFDGEILFDSDNLPFGVIVDNVGLSGVVIRKGETSRQIFLTSLADLGESTRQIHFVSRVGMQSTLPVTLNVRRAGAPSPLAQARVVATPAK